MRKRVLSVAAALVVLVALLVAADRVLAGVAEGKIAQRVASAYHLRSQPQVTIQGFPFLTQVAAGDYRQVDLSARDVAVGGVTLPWLRARFSGVHASVSQILGHGAHTVEADRAAGVALVPYSAVRQRLPKDVTVRPEGNDLTVSGTFGGVPVTAATVAVAAARDGIAVRLTKLAGASVPGLSFVIPLGPLPLHLAIRSVRVTPQGLRVGLAASHVLLNTAV